MSALVTSPGEPGIILLRLSDFRDEDEITFEMREEEARKVAASEGITDVIVLIENDLDASKTARGKSAHKENLRVELNGLVAYRSDRPVFTRALRMLQSRQRTVLIVGDESRISRNWADGKALLDAVRAGRASVLAISDESEPRWVLRNGGSREEVKKYMEEIERARQFSVDIGIKVAKGRRRWAGKSYQGGRRPFGYRVMKDTEPHKRNLVIDEIEAQVIREAAEDLLRYGISLNAVARKLREGIVPTVMGGPWSARVLRDVLIKPAVAGLAVRGGELVLAPWEPVLDRGTWEELRDMLTDPARRTNLTTANEPRWLLSGFARCEHGSTVKVNGGKGRAPAYVATGGCCWTRRQAEALDTYVAGTVIRQLDRNPDLLKPPPGPDVDRAAIRAELKRLAGKKASLVRRNVADLITDDELDVALREIRRLEKAAQERLAADPAMPDPLPEFRDKPAEAVWESLPMARRRAVAQLVIESVTIHPVSRKRGRGGFDPDSVTVLPRTF